MPLSETRQAGNVDCVGRAGKTLKAVSCAELLLFGQACLEYFSG